MSAGVIKSLIVTQTYPLTKSLTVTPTHPLLFTSEVHRSSHLKTTKYVQPHQEYFEILQNKQELVSTELVEFDTMHGR